MKGHLKSLILKMLLEKPMSGSEIMIKIEEMMNWKPSCGSIYPILNAMEKEKLTISKCEKGKKIYSTTNQAKKYLKEKTKEKQNLIKTMEKSYVLLESIYGFDTSLERSMLKDIKKGDIPFQEIYEESNQLKEELILMRKNNKFKENVPRIKKVLKKTILELKRINEEK